MIRDKNAENLALLYSGARFHYGRYQCSSTPMLKREAFTAIRECYEHISREEMQRRFPEIDRNLEGMFQQVKFV